MVSQAVRTPLKFHPAIAVGIIVVCALTILLLYWRIINVVGQIYALITLFFLFRYLTPLGPWVARMPRVHRGVFLILMACLVLGHFTFALNPRRFFPFMPWEIFAFAHEKDPVTCRELIGTTASGKTVRLLVEQLFPSIVQFDLPPQGDALQNLVQALTETYNQLHHDDPVRHVDLMLMAVQLHPQTSEARPQPSCEFLQRYEISSGQ